MLFKNILLYTFDDLDAPSETILNKTLQSFKFISTEDSSTPTKQNLGWYPPAYIQGGKLLTHTVNDCSLICLRIQERKVKPAMIKQKLRKRIESYQSKMEHDPSRKEIKQMEEEILAVLIRQVPPEDSYLYAYIDHKNHRFIVNSSSNNKAELICRFLRKTLGTFPALHWYSEIAPGKLMTCWLHEKTPPTALLFGVDVTLKAAGDQGSKAVLTHHDLVSEEIDSHLKADKMVQSLALEYEEKVSFVLTSDLVIKKIQWVSIQEDHDNSQSPIDIFDAEYTLDIMQHAQLLNYLIDVFDNA